MRFALILLFAICLEQWLADNHFSYAREKSMPIYFMYHPESDSLWTVASEQERDEDLEGDPCVVEIDEATYQAKQAELMGR